jgi:hypothetical protein
MMIGRNRECWDSIVGVLERWSHLGTRLTSLGVRQIGHVPHVAPQAWLHEIYWPLTDLEITGLDGTLPSPLPRQFCEFLAITNGLNLFSGALAIYGIRRTYEGIGDRAVQPYDLALHNFPGDRPQGASPSMVMIGGYSHDGSRLFYDASISSEAILRTPRRQFHIINQWDNFWTMLHDEVNRLSIMYDDKGRQIDPAMPTTPPELES